MTPKSRVRSGDRGSELFWTARPVVAASLRALLLLAPFLIGWLAVRATRQFYMQPEGWTGLAAWVAQAAVVAFAATGLSARAAERFAPLSILFGMTLAFPDRAPSRFAIALRAGSAVRLAALAADGPPTLTGDDPQKAAEEALALVTQLRDHEPLTRGHTERVRAYAELIGRELDLSEEDINGLRWAMLLHDIGKLGVPPEILSKPGTPTDDEWQILMTHPSIGGEIVKPLEPWLGEWTMAASQHHERWDGSGYPAGIAGPSISLVSRIAAVADAYDVMTSRRSYKAPRPAEEARRELVACSGTQFDPDVVRAFLRSGLGAHKHALGRWSWIMELPGLARLSGSIAQVPIAAAPAAIAALAVALPGASLGTEPDDLAFIERTVFAVESSAGDESDTNVTLIPADIGVVQTTVVNDSGDQTPTPQPTTSVPTGSGTTGSATTGSATTGPPPSTDPVDATNSSDSSDSSVGPRSTVASTVTTVAATTTIPPTPCQLLAAGESELPGANLAGCDFGGRRLDDLDLSNANLTNADLSGAEIVNFNLSGADLTGADLTQTELRDGSLVGANLSSVERNNLQILRVDLGYVTATRANFANAAFEQMSFGFAQVTNSSFVGATFQGVNFNDGTISGSDFGSATMGGTEFRRTVANGTMFVGTQLVAAVVESANLNNANMSGANLRNAEFEQADLTQADLTTADLLGATGTPASTAAIYSATVCPSGAVQSTSCW